MARGVLSLGLLWILWVAGSTEFGRGGIADWGVAQPDGQAVSGIYGIPVFIDVYEAYYYLKGLAPVNCRPVDLSGAQYLLLPVRVPVQLTALISVLVNPHRPRVTPCHHGSWRAVRGLSGPCLTPAWRSFSDQHHDSSVVGTITRHRHSAHCVLLLAVGRHSKRDLGQG